MGKICEQFEAETPADSEATQKARFEVVLDLMQQVRPPLAVCPLVLLGVCWWSRDLGKGLERRPYCQTQVEEGARERPQSLVPRRKERDHGPDSSFGPLFRGPFSFSSSSSFPATGFGPSSKRAGWGDGEYIFQIRISQVSGIL